MPTSDNVIDIRFGRAGFHGRLSNLMPRKFTFRGVECESMEGLLQSLKFEDKDVQKQVCKLAGHTARKAGKGIDWQTTQTLWWDGEFYHRTSNDYKFLLREMYTCLFTQNKEAQEDLLATGDAKLTHKTGWHKANETILTEKEFIFYLTEVRSVLRWSEKDTYELE